MNGLLLDSEVLSTSTAFLFGLVFVVVVTAVVEVKVVVVTSVVSENV